MVFYTFCPPFVMIFESIIFVPEYRKYKKYREDIKLAFKISTCLYIKVLY